MNSGQARLNRVLHHGSELLEADPAIAVAVVRRDHPHAIAVPRALLHAQPPQHVPQLRRAHVPVLVAVEHVERLPQLAIPGHLPLRHLLHRRHRLARAARLVVVAVVVVVIFAGGDQAEARHDRRDVAARQPGAAPTSAQLAFPPRRGRRLDDGGAATIVGGEEGGVVVREEAEEGAGEGARAGSGHDEDDGVPDERVEDEPDQER